MPSALGLATIHDKDILIYCISQLVAKMNAGVELQKTLHLKAYDLLVSTNRNTDGRGYEQLKGALDRLSGTRIRTNIKTGERKSLEGFGLIDRWRIVRQTASGRMTELRITLSDWVFNAVVGREVLTLHRDYFRLRKPLERRMYELARKHCGKQNEWVISLELLKKKCGSASEDYEFRRLVSIICDEDARPQSHARLRGIVRRRHRAVHQPQHDEAPPLARSAAVSRSSTRKPITTPAPSPPATTCTTWSSNGGVSGTRAASRS